MNTLAKQVIYELSLNVKIAWQGHSLSNYGSDGTNRTLPRHQLLADGTKTDAISGNLIKRHHANILTEYLEEANAPLCPACAVRDGRRAAVLIEQREDYKEATIESIIAGCAMCDIHGFLSTAKNADENGEVRQRLSKHSLINCTFALAGRRAETPQPFTRTGGADGNGQMIFKKFIRSGEYGLGIRYKAADIGVDSETKQIIVSSPLEREQRHRAILEALRDIILSPSGAMTATTMPHLTDIHGVIAIRHSAGRAPMYSPLEPDFVEILATMEIENYSALTFEKANQFSALVHSLIKTSTPALPRQRAAMI